MITYKDILQSIKKSTIVDFIIDDEKINTDFISSIKKELGKDYIIDDTTLNENLSLGTDLENIHLIIKYKIKTTNSNTVIIFNNAEKIFYSNLIDYEFIELLYNRNVILIFIRDIAKTGNTEITNYNEILRHSSFLLINKKIKILKSRTLENDTLSIPIILRELKLKNIIEL